MSTSFRPGRRPAIVLLAALLFGFPSLARSDDEDIKKQITDVEKQIAELQKKLDALKNPSPASVSLNGGTIPESAVKKMNWRSIGPANMGGRITAIAVVESDPTTYYIATASGGLLKTVNNGTTFTHLFDKESTVSIGDVAVSQSDPKVVWVGTGEHNPRNSVSYGDGVYKSTDGGKKWTNMGLKQSFQIGKILIHPKDANVVYVGALGRLYGPNEERGLFKTEDGGKTWKHILKVDDKTGVIDMRHRPLRSQQPPGRHVGTEARRLRHHVRASLGLVQPRPVRTRGDLRPRRRTLPLHRCGQDLEEADRREGRIGPAHRQDRPHRHRLLAQDQGTRFRHHRHRERRQGPAAADGLHGSLERQREGRRRPRHR